MSALAIAASVAELLLPLLPKLRDKFLEAWDATDDAEAAWAFLSPLLPSEARAAAKPIFLDVWNRFAPAAVTQAWTELQSRLSEGGLITKAVAPDFNGVVNELLDEAQAGVTIDREPAPESGPMFLDRESDTGSQTPGTKRGAS